MNKLLIISLLIIVVAACQKEAEIATPEEQEYFVYDQSLQCRPLEADSGFFVITLTDSVPWLIHIEQSGMLHRLLNLSSYFPSDIVYDSIADLNASHLSNGNIMVAFTFNISQDEDTLNMIRAIEIQQGGTLVDEFYQPIPTYNNIATSFVAISKNEADEWILVSSFTETSKDQNASSTLILQTSIFQNAGDSSTSENNIQSFVGLSIDQAYTLINSNIAIILTDYEEGPPDQVTTSGSYTLLTILPDGTSNQTTLDEAFVSIEVIKQVNDELLLVGTISRDTDESLLISIAFDDDNNILWQNNITVTSSYTPTSILVTDDGYILGGLNGDTREFSWNDVYDQTNNTLAIYGFDNDGQEIWNSNQTTEFSSLIVGGCKSVSGYSWLLTKKSYNTYNNIAMLKTKIESNL
jgi:hypothetical protein